MFLHQIFSLKLKLIPSMTPWDLYLRINVFAASSRPQHTNVCVSCVTRVVIRPHITRYSSTHYNNRFFLQWYVKYLWRLGRTQHIANLGAKCCIRWDFILPSLNSFSMTEWASSNLGNTPTVLHSNYTLKFEHCSTSKTFQIIFIAL